MPLPVRRSTRRGRRKGPDADCLAEVMAPTRMKLRGRRRDTPAAAAPAGDAALEEDEERPRRSSRRKTTNKAPASADAAPSSSASPPTTSSVTVRPAVAAEASPDSKCPICLDRFNNLAYLDHCLHRFCFPCIQEWSHNKPECPLCKQPFASILHSVRAEDDFKEYTLQPPRATNPLTASTFLTTVAAMTSDGSTQHHLRLMLRRHLVAADREALRRRRRRERTASGRRSSDRMGDWEVFMHSPPLPLSPYHMSELIMENMGMEEAFRRRDEEQRLVLNELTGLRGAAAPSRRLSRRLMCRLTSRQRLQREGGLAQMSEGEVLGFRKALYQCGIRVRSGSCNPWRQRSIDAESFRRSSSHLNRLQAWLQRELGVLLGSHASLADVVQRTVTRRALHSGLEDTAAIEEDLRPYLLTRTEHFVHELVNFARSPLGMASYDQQAVYEPPSSAMELDQISTSSDGSSVIAISEGEEEGEDRGGVSEGAAGGGNDDVTQTGSSLSLSCWDDETPGPSYTSAEPSHSFTSPPAISPAPQQPANQEAAEGHAEEEECLIVGFKKPIAERTPELVQLSSDSEEDEAEKKKKNEEEVEVEVVSAAPEKAPPPLSPAPPSSCIPVIPPSTSGTFRAEQAAGPREAWRRRSCSWSGSSDRSRKSVCSLSPDTPERRRGGREQRGERRKKKKKRGWDRSRENSRRSGSFYNPNRSIFPPMMARCALSPYDSSGDSASPRDPGWEFRFTQVSPLSSSVSSRSLSPLCTPPPGTPPTPSYSPKRHHVDKPGGKRKYKSRHLNSSSRDPSWRPHSNRRRKKEKGRKEGGRREKTGNSRRSREDRSPSVEIIYEGTLTTGTAQPPARKRRRKRHRRTQPTSSPVIITLDSDSSHDGASSSPLSSQQTIDFSDIPPLPPLPTVGGGGATDPDVGELPVDILDRGSDGSESEAVGRSRAARPVSLENMEDSISLLETSDDQTAAEPIRVPGEGANRDQREPAAATAAAERNGPKTLSRTDPEESPSDRNLLEAILHDLNRVTSHTDRDSGSGCPAEKMKRTQQENIQNCCWLEERTGSGPTANISRQQNQESPIRTSSPVRTAPTIRTSSALKDSREAPPLLRRASPVRSNLRNTPPPLKHKDGGSPQRGAACPQNAGPHCPSGSDPTIGVSPVLIQHPIPHITTLRNPLTKALNSSSGSNPFPAPGLGSVAPAEPGPSRDHLKLTLPADLRSRLSDLHPLHRSSTSGGPAGPLGLDAPGAVHLSSWGVYSGMNSSYAFPSRGGSEPPAGGAFSEMQNFGADLPLLSGSASNHMALAPPLSHHSSGFMLPNSNCSAQSQARSERFQRSESNPAPQNHCSFPQPEVHPHSDPSHLKAANRTFNQTADNPPSDPQSEHHTSQVPPS